MNLEPDMLAEVERLRGLLTPEGANGARDTAESVSVLSALLMLTASEAIACMAARNGMRWGDSYALSAKVMHETASLLVKTGIHPAQLKDLLCEPDSAAIRGLNTLEHVRLRASLIDACNQAHDQIHSAREADEQQKER